MISSSSCARVVPFAALAVLFPAVSYGQDVGEGEISLENLMDMVVTATLREQSTLDAPASIQVVTSADIRSRGYRNIKQIMNDVPGFNDVSDTNEEVVAVRGVFTSTTNKVLTLVNGHRMNDLMLGRYNADQFLGVDSIERIEFIRGPASALYGSGALVGIVNIITKKGADLSAGQVKLQAGVYGQEASASWGRQLVGYDVFFNFTYLDQEGQTLDQGSELDAFRRTINGVDTGERAPGKVYIGRYRQNMSGLFTLRSESSSLALRAAHFRRATPRGSNGAFYDYEMETLKPAYTENDFFGDYQYNWNIGKNKITFNPSIHFFSYYEQSFITWGVNRVGGNGQRSGTMGEYTNYQMKLNYERQVHDTLNIIGGVDGLMARFYRSDAITSQTPSLMGNNILLRPMSYTAPGNWFLGGAFAQAVFTPVQQVAITAGARFDTFEDEADARLTPRVGVVVKPVDALAVKLLYGQSYLAPMWAHTRANDGNFFVSSVCATLPPASRPGNCDPNLKLTPETFTGYNMIVAYGDKKANVTADFFYNKVEGLINGVNFTPMPNPENPMMPVTPPCDNRSGCVRYENSANSTYMGAELSGEAQVMSWLRLNGSYSFIRPDTSDPKSASLLWKSDLADPTSVTGNILGVPRHTLRYGVKVEPVSNLSLLVWGRAYLAHKAADFRAGGDTMTGVAPDLGLTSVPAVALFDAAINYNYNQWAFQLVGRNLTNRYYEMGGAVPRPLAREKLNVEGTVSMKF
jgi:outer membrane receptor protein involved in Fe transport